VSRRNLALRFYELATVYLPDADGELAREKTVLTLGAFGKGESFFTLKGCVEALLQALDVRDVRYKALRDEPPYHPGRCAAVYSGDTLIGAVGQVHPEVCQNYGVEGEVFAAELDMELLARNRAGEPSYKPLPRYPAVTRDIAVVTDAKIPVYDLECAIRKGSGKYLEKVKLFDVYTGEPIEKGKRSAAFSLTLRSGSQTLTDEIADEAVAGALKRLETDCGAVVR
jgi:phenylalanyl-tRNA synthetase beta chain